jgi:hypothetical protein
MLIPLPKGFDQTKLPKGTHVWARKAGLTEDEKRVAEAKLERLEAAYAGFIDSPEFRRACADYHGAERDRVVKALPLYRSLARAVDEAAPYFIATNLDEWER